MKRKKVIPIILLMLFVSVMKSYSQWGNVNPATAVTSSPIYRLGSVSIGNPTTTIPTILAAKGDVQIVEDVAGTGADIYATDINGNSIVMTGQSGTGYLKTNKPNMELIIGAGQWGENMYLKPDGRVGIGSYCFPTDVKLAVKGVIMATELRIKPFETNSCFVWPDYVFEANYKLLPLKEVEAYIIKNKHLPEIPSAKEVTEQGIPVGELNAKLLKKMEEITLYLIQIEKDNEKLRTQVEELQKSR